MFGEDPNESFSDFIGKIVNFSEDLNRYIKQFANMQAKAIKDKESGKSATTQDTERGVLDNIMQNIQQGAQGGNRFAEKKDEKKKGFFGKFFS